jgi:hypothetical protein
MEQLKKHIDNYLANAPTERRTPAELLNEPVQDRVNPRKPRTESGYFPLWPIASLTPAYDAAK